MYVLFICVIVLDWMWCTDSSIYWSNPKRFLSVVVVFEKYFDLKIFTKIQTFVTLHFHDLLASGLLSHKKRLRKIFKSFKKIDFSIFFNSRHSRLTHNWLASVSPSCKKDLENFFKMWFKGFWQLIRETVESRKMRVLQK